VTDKENRIDVKPPDDGEGKGIFKIKRLKKVLHVRDEDKSIMEEK
jgi:hypothetical protein